jgi:hypothetical protein
MIHWMIHGGVLLCTVVTILIAPLAGHAGWSASRILFAFAGGEVFCWSFLRVLTRSYALLTLQGRRSRSKVAAMILCASVIWSISFCMVALFVPSLACLAVFFLCLCGITVAVAWSTQQFAKAKISVHALLPINGQ